MDGRINSYDAQSHTHEGLEKIAKKESPEDMKDILEVVGYRVITKADLV